MALVKCYECGKEISDKATACPGCGCPVKQPKNYGQYGKEALWQKAYNIQYKGSKSDLPEAIDIYKFLIANYSDSNEAEYAYKQLEILGKVSLPMMEYIKEQKLIADITKSAESAPLAVVTEPVANVSSSEAVSGPNGAKTAFGCIGAILAILASILLIFFKGFVWFPILALMFYGGRAMMKSAE